MKRFFMSIFTGLSNLGKAILSILLSIAAIIMWIPYSILYPTRVVGRKNLTKYKSGRIFVCNHFSNNDVVLITIFVRPIAKMKFLSKAELGKNKLFGWILSAFGAIFIDRNKLDRIGIKNTTKALKSGKIVSIFPEGTRNKTNTDEVQTLKNGVIFFSNTTDSYIIPARFLTRPKLFKKNYIIIGEPYKPQKGNKEQLEKETHILSEKLENLKQLVTNKKKKEVINE